MSNKKRRSCLAALLSFLLSIVLIAALLLAIPVTLLRYVLTDRNIELIVDHVIDSFEIVKIIVLCIRSQSIEKILYVLPLFLCSIQLITIPLAAFGKGRFKEAALDFVLIFGILGGLLGTVGAAQNYNAYPAFSWPNIVSATTHTISAFSSLYIAISGMSSLKKRNIGITYAILFSFGIAAYITNIILDYNYMFLMNHDGTPYEYLYNWVGGSPVWYPICVMMLFVVYIAIFYFVHAIASKKKQKKAIKVAA